MSRKVPIAACRATKLGYSDVRVLSVGTTYRQSARLPTESAMEACEREPNHRRCRTQLLRNPANLLDGSEGA